MIEAVFTDLDGVIRYWENDSLFALEEQLELPRGFTFKHAFHESLLQLVITGQIDHEQWCQEVVNSLGTVVSIDTAITLVDAWSTTPSTIDKDVIHQLRILFPKASLAIVSNATSPTRTGFVSYRYCGKKLITLLIPRK